MELAGSISQRQSHRTDTELAMLRTITIGSCVSVQGLQVGQTPDGMLIVHVDEKNYVGRPVIATRKS
jgi:hypothetical protein